MTIPFDDEETSLSWDIFVQDLPPGIRSVTEIPDDFVPGAIGRRASVVEAITTVAPDVDFSDPAWGRIVGPGYSVEVSIPGDDPIESFAFHLRGGEMEPGIIAEILERLGLRAIDPQSETGLFDPATAAGSLRRWRAYRDQVVR
jgi:hypothetical protein